MMDVAKYQDFLKEYKAFETEYWSDAFKTEKEKLLPLLAGYKVFDKYVLSEIVITESPQYNIFSILNVRHYEEKLHTPFLVNLLNPKGSHGQGALFLDLFFELVLKLKYRYDNIQSFRIKEEHNTKGKGRIDIIMTFYNGSERMAIVIENKIYGEDQPKQLERYYEYLVSQGLNDETGKLYYLTPKKEPPKKNVSISFDLEEDLRERCVLHNIGYHKEIRPWLQYSLSKIKSPKVKFTIEQYLKIIQTL